MCLLFCGYAIADGAFGIYRGMTKEDIEKKGINLKLIGESLYVSNNALETNKNFVLYKYLFNRNTQKICQTVGISGLIDLDKDKLILKQKINSIKSMLDEKYGEPISDESTLSYLWGQSTKLKNNKNIFGIHLYYSALDKNKAIMLIVKDYKPKPYGTLLNHPRWL